MSTERHVNLVQLSDRIFSWGITIDQQTAVLFCRERNYRMSTERHVNLVLLADLAIESRVKINHWKLDWFLNRVTWHTSLGWSSEIDLRFQISSEERSNLEMEILRSVENHISLERRIIDVFSSTSFMLICFRENFLSRRRIFSRNRSIDSTKWLI